MSAEKPTQPKIIVDSNWKERVQAEKEALREESESGSDQSQGQPQSSAQEIPPASFSLLVSSFATQALAALGQIPDPEQQEPLIRLDLARHYIDMLNMLEEKTKDNLNSDESMMLSNVLHELRMLYVAVQNQGVSPGAPDSEQS